jgi:hypothetical protein
MHTHNYRDREKSSGGHLVPWTKPRVNLSFLCPNSLKFQALFHVHPVYPSLPAPSLFPLHYPTRFHPLPHHLYFLHPIASHSPPHTAKTKCRKFERNIPRKGISGPQSQFPHSCVCERIIYSHDGSACSAGGNM